MNKRSFYYLECENKTKLFKLLDNNVDEGFITYTVSENDGFIVIKNLLLDDDDDLFKKLEDLDLIEEEFDSFDDDDYLSDDFDDTMYGDDFYDD